MINLKTCQNRYKGKFRDRHLKKKLFILSIKKENRHHVFVPQFSFGSCFCFNRYYPSTSFTLDQKIITAI